MKLQPRERVSECKLDAGRNADAVVPGAHGETAPEVVLTQP